MCVYSRHEIYERHDSSTFENYIYRSNYNTTNTDTTYSNYLWIVHVIQQLPFSKTPYREVSTYSFKTKLSATLWTFHSRSVLGWSWISLGKTFLYQRKIHGLKYITPKAASWLKVALSSGGTAGGSSKTSQGRHAKKLNPAQLLLQHNVIPQGAMLANQLHVSAHPW